MPTPQTSTSQPSEPQDESAQAYCLRLAQQVRAYEQQEADTPAKREAFGASWRAAFRYGTLPLSGATEPQMVEALLAEPRAQARLAAIVEYPPSKWLLEQELTARGNWPKEEKPGSSPDAYEVAAEAGLKGLCFSGGGIRSATFNLGVLQGLAALDKLQCFDYLSSVSGGGYIHQFLASWIKCENLKKVKEQLEPLPGPPSQRTTWPDPLRWLRRYSNYLTPQKGMFSADTWVAFSIWLRNTFLNQIVLVSTLLLILLLPHFYLSSRGRIARHFVQHGDWAAIVIVICFTVAAIFVAYELNPKPPNDCSQADPKPGLSQLKILFCVFVPMLAALMVFSPYLYRSAFWRGTPLPERPLSALPEAEKQRELDRRVEAAHVLDIVNWPADGGLVPVSTRSYISHLHKLSPPTAPAPPAPHQEQDGQRSKAVTPSDPGGFTNLRAWQSAYSFHWWAPFEDLSRDRSTSLVFYSMLVSIAIFVLSSLKALVKGWKRIIILLGIAGAVGTAYLLINLSRLIIFVSSFLLPLDHVTRVFIPLLPPLVLAIVFISVEIAGGLIGNLVDESVREWYARLRAWSFLFAIVWFGLTACSLLGAGIINLLTRGVWTSRSLVIGWLGTTLVSVMAGKSPLTSGTAKDTKSPLSTALDLLALIGPPVFITGLLLALSAVVERFLSTVQARWGSGTIPHLEFLLVFAVLAGVMTLFGWRIDINEFSLHAFYRDRLARCYAGASNPDRRANRFTGFAASDKRLRLVDLLPERFGDSRTQHLWAPDCSDPEGKPKPESLVAPTYEGPFPIFCTTINLAFGQDLAYQERKAASFVFTPLYCGYDVGWTEADDDRVQFNGFTPTRDFAFENGGPHMATAVAASGAAISPNDGYHSSPTMAFLLTIFNVRLGLWIRNPRHKKFRLKFRGKASSPWFGLFYLLTELFGMANDDSAFVYITDGGHFENMGMYELVRRHCSTIVICDSEQDGDLSFGGIGMAIRKCRIDFGAEIDLDLSPLVPKGDPPASPQHFVEGSIRYPNGATGSILYIKSTFTTNLPGDLVNFRKEHPAFPNDTTLNQWFTESQFESYRRLGLRSVLTGGAATWLKTL